VDTYKAVVISSFSKLLAIPAYIWAGDWTSVLPQVLQVVTRFQVFKGDFLVFQEVFYFICGLQVVGVYVLLECFSIAL